MNDGYKLICFEKGAQPVLPEQLENYISYSFESLSEMLSLFPTLDSNYEGQKFQSNFYSCEKILLEDVDKAVGNPEMVKRLNKIIFERVKAGKITILIGAFIPSELLYGINEESIFCTDIV